MDFSLRGSSVHGILQAKILEWVAMPSSRGSSRPRDWTQFSFISCIAGGFFTTEPWESWSTVHAVAKNLPAKQETWFWSLGWEDPLEKEMAAHSSIFPWEIPWTEEPGMTLQLNCHHHHLKPTFHQLCQHEYWFLLLSFIHSVIKPTFIKYSLCPRYNS